jgi:hypothetical protein
MGRKKSVLNRAQERYYYEIPLYPITESFFWKYFHAINKTRHLEKRASYTYFVLEYKNPKIKAYIPAVYLNFRLITCDLFNLNYTIKLNIIDLSCAYSIKTV